MSVVKFNTQHFRNLKDTSVEFDPQVNVILGNNGSGKSSILEALFFVGHGKSFRTTKVNKLAALGEQQFVVSLLDDKSNRLGLSRDIQSTSTLIKINGEKSNKLSQLASHFAVQIVTPESFKLFFGGPKERRKFVDLGMFHVKHEFLHLWKDFSRVLKQRNACLKIKDKRTLQYWDQQFVSLSNDITQIRKKYIEELTSELEEWLAILLPQVKQDLEIAYFYGWNKAKALEDQLADALDKELMQGYSQYGAHKFDLRFTCKQTPVDISLSRGQQKLFLLALTLAQTSLIAKAQRVKPILLIDDFGAELDTTSRTAVSKALSKLDSQIIITAIEEGILKELYDSIKGNFKMFHVEHGTLTVKSE
ncbi:DNA replication/repair protein RecF [Thalassotalea agarivorans]|uniref:DNA replication and repair protein RecF n=1 Tax=Thalassotalea agarivorans TaxID=349064 RepID=A0A1I0GCS2_THASX|nr:DNA replication/repair protein RecF [Thalassotalea agarivorans]SET68705.1 DNA replication and repair protein RecF [Thalassotalea agarivorans]